MNGKAFGQYTGVYGFLITIKLGEVYAVMDCTSESLQKEADDSKLKEEQEKFS
jgi:hypothetical protein